MKKRSIYSDDDSELTPELTALGAYLLAKREGPERALARLRAREDPEALYYHLSILLEQGDHAEAARIAQATETHARWVDKAIEALVKQDLLAEAISRIEWVTRQRPPDRNLLVRCSWIFINEIFIKIFPEKVISGPLRTLTLTPLQIELMESTAEIAQAPINFVKSAHVISNELELGIIEKTIIVYIASRQEDRLAELLPLLDAYSPVPLLLGRLAMQKIVPPSIDLAERLRTQHRDTYEAQVLSISMYYLLLGKTQSAFEYAERLLETEAFKDQRRESARFIVEIAQHIEKEAAGDAARRARAILQHEGGFLKLVDAASLLSSGRLEEAAKLIEATRNENDPTWLQIHARYKELEGDVDAALEDLHQLVRLSPEPRFLHELARLALENSVYEPAKNALTRAIELDPQDLVAHHNLALIYARLDDFENAAREYSKLSELRDEDESYKISRVVNLALSGRLQQALDVCEALASQKSPSIDAIITRARILERLRDPEEAFASLERFSREERFWNDMEFMRVYLHLAFASDNDKRADRALQHILSLQKAKPSEDPVVSLASIEDFNVSTEDLGKHLQDFRARILHGKMPWLAVETSFANTPSYLNWSSRTKELDRAVELPQDRASFTTYITNGFHSKIIAEGGTELRPIECAPRDSVVVVDLTALFTLHGLGILGPAAKFFKKMLYPSSYMRLRLADGVRLEPLQLSPRTAAEEIRDAVLEGQIGTVSKEDARNSDIVSVDEYCASEGAPGRSLLRFIDVYDALAGYDLLDAEEMMKLRKLATTDSAKEGSCPELRPGAKVQFGIMSLFSLWRAGLFQRILGIFVVHIFGSDYQFLIRQASWFAFQQRCKREYKKMWSEIDRHAEIGSSPLDLSSLLEKSDESPIGAYSESLDSIAGYLLSRQLRRPLLIDDRCLQAGSLNDAPKVSSFGSDVLVRELANEGILSRQQEADLLLTMIKWRYRFILPSVGALKTFADRHRDRPPGVHLRTVAEYVQDCMRDPGLFVGAEAVDPPTSMAQTLFSAWVGIIGGLLAEIWADADYGLTQCQAYTEWALTELLPMAPAHLGPKAKVIGNLTPRMMLSHFLLRAAALRIPDRNEQAYAALRSALGLNEATALQIATGVFNGI